MKEEKSANIVWGLILIILGIVFLGNAINIWNIELFFDGWWTLFIVVPSIIGLFKHGAKTSSFIGIIIGLLLFLACQDLINWDIVWKAIFPIILVGIGLSLIFRPKSFVEKKKVTKGNKEVVNYTAIFSNQEENVSKKFEAASCVAVFGGIDLDLRKAKIKEDIVIDCVSVFGGIDILVPDGINLKTSGVPIFGGAESKVSSTDDKKPTLYINYTCVFGGIEIK